MGVYTKEQYSAMLGTQVNSTTPAERQLQNEIFQCEGLMRKNSDFFAGYDSLMSDITGGFYVDGTDSINIILQDTVSGPSLEDLVAIFHELIHACRTSISTSRRCKTMWHRETRAMLCDTWWRVKRNCSARTSSTNCTWEGSLLVNADNERV